MKITVRFHTTRIIKTIIGISIILVILSISTQLYRILESSATEFTRFNLDKEANIPTYFSTMLLLICSLLLLLIYKFKNSLNDGYRIYWLVLSLLFFMMSLDEAASIHEMLINPLRMILGTSGFFYFAWIVPAMITVILFIVLFFRFWLTLDKKSKVFFALSAIIYVTGAIGLEGLGGMYKENNSALDVSYMLLTTIEETLEITGVSVFIYALLKYLEKNFSESDIHLLFKSTS